MRYSNTPAPTPFTFEKFPCPSRYSAVVTLAAAVTSSSSNQRRNGERPEGSRYSATRISGTDYGNVYVTIAQAAVARALRRRSRTPAATGFQSRSAVTPSYAAITDWLNFTFPFEIGQYRVAAQRRCGRGSPPADRQARGARLHRSGSQTAGRVAEGAAQRLAQRVLACGHCRFPLARPETHMGELARATGSAALRTEGT